MASSHGNTHSEATKMEQVITEFFAKSLHIILESTTLSTSSRNFSGDQVASSPSSSSSSSSSARPRDKGFNLALRECPAALENIDLWRQSYLEPMVVDVVLVQRPLGWDPVSFSPKRVLPRSSSPKELGLEAEGEKIVERWLVQYETRKTRDSNSGSRRSSNISLNTLSKKSTLLLRSLYATVRLLPAYKLFRELNSSGKIRPFALAHRVSSFFEPFTRREEAEMLKFGFTPVDASSSGRLCLSVMYRPSVSDVIPSEPSTPLSPQVITDYVGSPMADPLRRIPSLPATGLPPHGSPSSLPSSRRHSWSYDHCRASPPSLTYSPSPTHSESHTSVSNASYRRYPLPPHPSEMMTVLQKKNTSFDDYCPSPNFSPSPSPSPPIYILGSSQSKTLLRSESAPVSIPTATAANSPGYSKRHNLPPSPPLGGLRCTSKTDRSMNLTQTGATGQKLFSLGKDESRKYSGTKIASNSSPQVSFSRSSSRSYQDDFDDPDFTYPFVYDDDMTDPGSRAESFDRGAGGFFPIKKSQDAAVGALIQILKKAPPLRQDFSTSEHLSQGTSPETWSGNIQEPNQTPDVPTPVTIMSSGLITNRKTTADALEEFNGYRQMKNLLLMCGSKPQI